MTDKHRSPSYLPFFLLLTIILFSVSPLGADESEKRISLLEGGYRRSSWEIVTTGRPLFGPGMVFLAPWQLGPFFDGYVNSWKMSLPEGYISYTYLGDALILGISGHGTTGVYGGGRHIVKSYSEIPGVTGKKLPGFNISEATYRDIAYPIEHPADYEILSSSAYNRMYGASGSIGVRFSEAFHTSLVYSHNRFDGKSNQYGGFRISPDAALAIGIGGNFKRSTTRNRVALEFVYRRSRELFRPYINFTVGYDDIRINDKIYDLKARSVTNRSSGYGIVAETGVDLRFSDRISILAGIRFDRSFTELYRGNVRFIGMGSTLLTFPISLADLPNERKGYTIIRENTFFFGAGFRIKTSETDSHHRYQSK